MIGVGAMKGVGMKEEGVAGIQFGIDQLLNRRGRGDAFGIGSRLFAVASVFDPSHFVRPFE